MATKALGKESVLAVSMPCNSNSADFEDAKIVSETFGVKLITVDLTESYNYLTKKINDNLENSKLNNEALINIKPRLRMITLYSIAQTLGYLVIRNREFI